MGFVSFVSSGPGDPELLTIKAMKRLQDADVVLYDDLSSGPILEHVNPDADLISVGKRAGRASPRQDHISRLLVDYARGGQKVVRLKSGDSGMFGRLEEEIVAITAEGFDYEVIPGVTSAMAAAAAAKIPMTRREKSRRVQFVTGHALTGELPEDINLPALADPDATTAIFMGKRTFPGLAAKLMAAGMPGDTSTLLAENVSHPNQNIIRSTVAELAKSLAEAKVDGPAMILVGPLYGADL